MTRFCASLISLALMALLMVPAAVYASQNIMLQVEPKSLECFHVDVTKPDSFTVVFTVTRGGKLDINLVVSGPTGEIHRELYFFDESREDFLGTYTFDAREAGTYNICFDNQMSRYTAKVVSFSVTANNQDDDVKPDSIGDQIARKGDLDPIEWGLTRINNALIKVEQEQSAYRIREQAHRDLAEKMAHRVFFFALSECLVICAISAAQIFYLRRWFNKRSERIS